MLFTIMFYTGTFLAVVGAGLILYRGILSAHRGQTDQADFFSKAKTIVQPGTFLVLSGLALIYGWSEKSVVLLHDGISEDLCEPRVLQTARADGGLDDRISNLVAALNSIPTTEMSDEDVGRLLVRILRANGALRQGIRDEVIRTVLTPGEIAAWCEVEKNGSDLAEMPSNKQREYKRAADLISRELRN